MATAVLVVILRLCNRVIDVNGWNLQLTVGNHFVETVNAGGGFLGDAVNAFQHFRILLVQHTGEVTAVVENHIGFPRLTVFENGLLDTPFVFFFGFTLPCKDRYPRRRDRCSCVVLGGENVTRRPANFGAECNQCVDEHTGLNGHMDTAQDFCTGERLLVAVLVSQGN